MTYFISLFKKLISDDNATNFKSKLYTRNSVSYYVKSVFN